MASAAAAAKLAGSAGGSGGKTQRWRKRQRRHRGSRSMAAASTAANASGRRGEWQAAGSLQHLAAVYSMRPGGERQWQRRQRNRGGSSSGTAASWRSWRLAGKQGVCSANGLPAGGAWRQRMQRLGGSLAAASR